MNVRTLVQVLLVSLGVLAAIVVLVLFAVRRFVRRVSRRIDARLGGRGTAALTSRSRRGHGRPGAGPQLGLVGLAAAPLSGRWARVTTMVPGPTRQVAAVRRELRLDLLGSKRAVAAGRADGRPVQGLESLMRRLAEQVRILEVDLAVIGNEPDRGLRRRLLDAQSDRLASIHRACAEIRRAVLMSGNIATTSLLRSLENDLNDEVIALAFQARAYASIQGGAASP